MAASQHSANNATEQQQLFVYPKMNETRLKNEISKAVIDPTPYTKPKSTGYVGEANRAGIKINEDALLKFWHDIDSYAEQHNVLHDIPAKIVLPFLEQYGKKYWGSSSPYKAVSSNFEYPKDGKKKTPLWMALKRLWRYKLQCLKQKQNRPSQSQDEINTIKRKSSHEPPKQERQKRRRPAGTKRTHEYAAQESSDETAKPARKPSPYVNEGFKFVTADDTA